MAGKAGMEIEQPAAAELALTDEGKMLLAILDGTLEPPAVDPTAFTARITRAMLEAETPEQALAAGATVSFEDGLLGVPLEVRDLVYRKSTLTGDSPVFAIIDAYRLDEGIELTVTCSAAQVLRTLGVWKVKGWLPSTFIVEKQGQPTAAGFTPYTIKAV